MTVELYVLSFTKLVVNQQIRSKFDENRGESDQLKIQKLIVLAEQTELIFKKNVVQGRPKSNDPETFELHLNEDSELGENDRRSSGPIAVPPKPKRK